MIESQLIKKPVQVSEKLQLWCDTDSKADNN